MAITALDIGTTDLLAALDEGVLTLTLNRPEARNAMSRAINHALARQLAVAALEPNVRCIVLTGAGKGFCAGGDVKGMAASGDGTVGAATIDEAIDRQRVNQRETAGVLFKMPKPTLAALPGPAAGAGLSLALACDLRIMASTAIMTTAFARLGFAGEYGVGPVTRTEFGPAQFGSPSSCSGRGGGSPRPERFVSEDAKRAAGGEVALDVECVVDGGVNGQETLGGSGRFETLHLALAPSCRLMRILGPVVCVQAVVMASRQSNFGLRRAVRAQFVRY